MEGPTPSSEPTSRQLGDRASLYGVALIILTLIPWFAFTWTPGHNDWQAFRAAGATVGTPNLLDPHHHFAWQIAHDLTPQAFVYPPAVAWLFAPAAHLTYVDGFHLNVIAMFAVCIAAGLVAARTYRIKSGIAIILVLAWAPATSAAFQGQFTPVAMLLAVLAAFAMSNDRWLLLGLAVGLLLYKPSDGLAFVVLLLARREWRALAVVAALCVVWYFASVAATAGDWNWPIHYLQMLHGYYGSDLSGNIVKVISLPTILMRLGTSATLSMIAALILLILCAALLARIEKLEAASMTPLIGLAVSVHAWSYEAAIAIPAVFWAITHVADPWRARIVATAYGIASLWVFYVVIGFEPLAIVVLGGTLLWIARYGMGARATT